MPQNFTATIAYKDGELSQFLIVGGDNRVYSEHELFFILSSLSNDAVDAQLDLLPNLHIESIM